MATKRKNNAGPRRKASNSKKPRSSPATTDGLWVDTLALARMRRVTKPPYGPKPILSKDHFLELADIALGGMNTVKPKK